MRPLCRLWRTDTPKAVGVCIGYEEGEARRIYAGSDFLLMPPRVEPCGSSQMCAQRFGSLPIAHQTGGLVDTIEDGITGFLFRDFSVAGLLSGTKRASAAFGSRGRLRGQDAVPVRQVAGLGRLAAGMPIPAGRVSGMKTQNSTAPKAAMPARVRKAAS